jgi:hypothetical protein
MLPNCLSKNGTSLFSPHDSGKIVQRKMLQRKTVRRKMLRRKTARDRLPVGTEEKNGINLGSS